MKLPWRKKNKSGDGNGNCSNVSSSTSNHQNDNTNVKSTGNAIEMKHDSDFVVIDIQQIKEPKAPSSPATASSTLCCGQYDIASTTKDGTPIQLVVLDETTTSSTTNTVTTTATASTGNESSLVGTSNHRNDNDCIVQSGSSHSTSSSSMDEYVFMTPLQSAELFEDSSTTIVIDNSTTTTTILNNTHNKTFQTVDNALASSSSTLSKCLQTAESTLTEDTAMTDGTSTPTTVVDDVDDTNHETDIRPTPTMLEQQAQSQSNQGHSTPTPITFLRHSSSFLRVSDLIGLDTNMDLSEHSSSCHGGQKVESIPNYHCCSELPPPGIPHDPIEKWVALDDGTSYNSNNNNINNEKTSIITPIAQYAVDALANTALQTMYDHQMWEPDSKTMKIIEAKTKIATNHNLAWEINTFQQYNCDENQNTPNNTNMILEDHILIWTGTFGHGLYGSDIPAIRSAAVIHMSSKDLVQLLMDSNRVQEYNTMSLGRKDLLTLLPSAVLSSVLPTTTNGRPILTKVMRSESRPPLLRKTLQFTSILHVRELDDDGTFLLVTRAVEKPKSNNSNSSNSNVIVSEILLGVNVIKKVPSHYSNTKESCILLSVNHVRSPMVPLYIAKRLGLQAATNFVNDLRKCC